MRHILLSITAVAATLSSIAQPTLTAANSNPVPGDKFYGVYCNTTGVSKGPSGAAVTWDFSTLTAVGYDSIAYVACAGTTYCDTFPGSTVATEYDGDFDYFITDASGFYYTGYGMSGGCAIYSDYSTRMVYPFTYNSTHVDDYSMVQAAFSTWSYGKDSMLADGWGTLILPTGTYSNVLRVRYRVYSTDSFAMTTPADVNRRLSEQYLWFMPGMHMPLLSMYFDTSGTGTLDLWDVEYFSGTPVGVKNTKISANDATILPNPADGASHIHLNMQTAGNVQVTITDIVGRQVGAPLQQYAAKGITDINLDVAALPSGMYMVNIMTPSGAIQRKLQIAR